MSLKDRIKELKKRVTGEQKQETGMPPRYIQVHFKESARKKGLAGDRHKEILIVEEGRVVRTYPYTESIVRSYKEEQNLPVFDETGGRPEPDPDILDVLQPGKIRVK